MHLFGGRWWLSAALLLLLSFSSPLTWLVQGAPRAMPCQMPVVKPCCCPQNMAMAAPCCQLAPASAPLAVALLAPARSILGRARLRRARDRSFSRAALDQNGAHFSRARRAAAAKNGSGSHQFLSRSALISGGQLTRQAGDEIPMIIEPKATDCCEGCGGNCSDGTCKCSCCGGKK